MQQGHQEMTVNTVKTDERAPEKIIPKVKRRDLLGKW